MAPFKAQDFWAVVHTRRGQSIGIRSKVASSTDEYSYDSVTHRALLGTEFSRRVRFSGREDGTIAFPERFLWPHGQTRFLFAAPVFFGSPPLFGSPVSARSFRPGPFLGLNLARPYAFPQRLHSARHRRPVVPRHPRFPQQHSGRCRLRYPALCRSIQERPILVMTTSHVLALCDEWLPSSEDGALRPTSKTWKLVFFLFKKPLNQGVVPVLRPDRNVGPVDDAPKLGSETGRAVDVGLCFSICRFKVSH